MGGQSGLPFPQKLKMGKQKQEKETLNYDSQYEHYSTRTTNCVLPIQRPEAGAPCPSERERLEERVAPSQPGAWETRLHRTRCQGVICGRRWKTVWRLGALFLARCEPKAH